jgi:hypothetical protein
VEEFKSKYFLETSFSGGSGKQKHSKAGFFKQSIKLSVMLIGVLPLPQIYQFYIFS